MINENSYILMTVDERVNIFNLKLKIMSVFWLYLAIYTILNT